MTQEGTRGKFMKMLLWGGTFIFGLLMLVAGASKFAQPQMWTENFRMWGYPGAFAYVIGVALSKSPLSWFSYLA